MDKYEVAQIFRELGTLIELTDKIPKKAIAYRKAAHTIETIPDLHSAVEMNVLTDFPGIGRGIASMVMTLIKTGRLPFYEHLKNSIPNSLIDLVKVPGLGAKRTRFLYENYHIQSVFDLEQAIKEGKIVKAKGFGPAFLQKIQLSIQKMRASGHSLIYPQASSLAHVLIDILKDHVQKIEIVGALRRKLEVIDHIEFVVVTNQIEQTLDQLGHHGLIKSIIKQEKNRIECLTKQDIRMSLTCVSEEDYVATLFTLTGNQIHVSNLKKQITNRYYQSEQEIYTSLEMDFIPPELREGYGEIEAARNRTLPKLIEEKDLKGTFHCHTVDSDGQNTLEEMAIAAQEMGWEYIGISDHSQASYQAHGMDSERLFSQQESIRQLNRTFDSQFQIFTGIECDILKDGQLDFPDEILSTLDFVIASIHRRFKLNEEEMTARLIRAIENPYVTMIGHLTGRILRHRESYALNIPKVIDACIANDKIIELNAYPNRLDMDWRLWIQAKDRGLKCSINPDAHSTHELFNCHYGIYIARKGWLEKQDVINTYSLDEMRSYLKKRKSKT